MYKQKVGMSIHNNYLLPTHEVVKMLKRIGFDAVSPEWKKNIDLTKVINEARNCGLVVQSLHAPYEQAAAMWSCDENVYMPSKMELLNALDDCKAWNIPIMVVHTWIGFEYDFNHSNLDFKNYDELVARAEEYNIKIAFENTEGEEYLFALMQHYKDNQTVGFCWDSGHEMCYNHSQDLLAKYGERLIMTHLNDNLGISRFDGQTYWTDDLHLLPYDGIADWDYNIERLKNSKHMEILNFELNIKSKPNRHENDVYAQMDLELYFTEAYKRACKIAYRYVR